MVHDAAPQSRQLFSLLSLKVNLVLRLSLAAAGRLSGALAADIDVAHVGREGLQPRVLVFDRDGAQLVVAVLVEKSGLDSGSQLPSAGTYREGEVRHGLYVMRRTSRSSCRENGSMGNSLVSTNARSDKAVGT